MPPRARKLKAVPAADLLQAPNLSQAVRDAVAGMNWLTPSDYALRDLAVRLADEIEEAKLRAPLWEQLRGEISGAPQAWQRLRQLEELCNPALAIAKLGPLLHAALRDLGGAPKQRGEFATERKVGGRLAALRAASARPDAAS